MKAKLIYRDGLWWCFRIGVTGCGETPVDAYRDMCQLFTDFLIDCAQRHQDRRKVRLA